MEPTVSYANMVTELREYQFACLEEERLREELQHWNARATGGVASFDAHYGGTGEDSLQMAVEQILKLKLQLNLQLYRVVNSRLALERRIDALAQPSMRVLLRYRFIYNYSMEQITDSLKYSERQIYNLSKKAVEELIRISGGAQEEPVAQSTTKKKLACTKKNQPIIGKSACLLNKNGV